MEYMESKAMSAGRWTFCPTCGSKGWVDWGYEIHMDRGSCPCPSGVGEEALDCAAEECDRLNDLEAVADPEPVTFADLAEIPAESTASAARGDAVAWRVKDFADGWILCHSEAEAKREAESAGNLIQALGVIDSGQMETADFDIAEALEQGVDHQFSERSLVPDLQRLWNIADRGIGSDWTHNGNGWITGLLDGIAAFDVAAINPHAELSEEGQAHQAEFVATFHPRAVQDLILRLQRAETVLATAMVHTTSITSVPLGEMGARVVVEMTEESNLYDILSQAWDASRSPTPTPPDTTNKDGAGQ